MIKGQKQSIEDLYKQAGSSPKIHSASTENELSANARDSADAARFQWLCEHGDTSDWEVIGYQSDKRKAIDEMMKE